MTNALWGQINAVNVIYATNKKVNTTNLTGVIVINITVIIYRRYCIFKKAALSWPLLDYIDLLKMKSSVLRYRK